MMLKSIVKEILEIVVILVIAMIIVIPIRFFLFSPFIVRGASMEPTFSDTDYLIVEKVTSEFKRGDVIVINRDGTNFLKRIIGLPGETIKINQGNVYIIKNNQTYLLSEDFIKEKVKENMQKAIIREDEFFVMGDNRNNSFDSRRWGAITKDQVSGVVLLRLFPFNEIEFFNFVEPFKVLQLSN